MLAWLKKVVLDIMPSVAATIIGAYIVNYYIVPKARESTAASASFKADGAKTTDGLAFETKTEPAVAERPAVKAKAASEKASFEKAVAEKTAIEKTAEKADKAATEKSDASPESRRGQPSSKSAGKSAPAATIANASTDRAADERRGVNDLARAAIERLRGSAHIETAKAEPAKVPSDKMVEKTVDKPADAPPIQSVSTVASASSIQPLPPAITVSRPNPDVFEQGSAAPVMRQPYPQATSRSDEQRRFTPPADIPASRPMDLRAEASAPLSDRTSVTDDVVSAAKSMFHAVIPR